MARTPEICRYGKELEYPAIDPSFGDGAAIRWASAFGRMEVVRLLWNDPRVWASSNVHVECWSSLWI